MSSRGWNRALTPEQERAVRLAVRAGADTNALASAYGVHRRTIQRTLVRGESRLERVRVGPWEGVFEVSGDEPVRVGPWRMAVDNFVDNRVARP